MPDDLTALDLAPAGRASLVSQVGHDVGSSHRLMMSNSRRIHRHPTGFIRQQVVSDDLWEVMITCSAIAEDPDVSDGTHAVNSVATIAVAGSAGVDRAGDRDVDTGASPSSSDP